MADMNGWLDTVQTSILVMPPADSEAVESF